MATRTPTKDSNSVGAHWVTLLKQIKAMHLTSLLAWFYCLSQQPFNALPGEALSSMQSRLKQSKLPDTTQQEQVTISGTQNVPQMGKQCFADSGKGKQSKLPLKENSTFSNRKTQGSPPAGSTWMPVVYLATELQSMGWKTEKTLHLNSPSMAYTPPKFWVHHIKPVSCTKLTQRNKEPQTLLFPISQLRPLTRSGALQQLHCSRTSNS